MSGSHGLLEDWYVCCCPTLMLVVLFVWIVVNDLHREWSARRLSGRDVTGAKKAGVECPSCGGKTGHEDRTGRRSGADVVAGVVAVFAFSAASWALLVALEVETGLAALRFHGLALACGAVGVTAGALALRSSRGLSPSEFVCDACAHRWQAPREGGDSAL